MPTSPRGVARSRPEPLAVVTIAYAYRAARTDGTIETGTIEAESRHAAASRLSETGLFPVDLDPSASSTDRRSRIGAHDLALGFRLLADLLEAGLPLTRALGAFEAAAPAAWKPGLGAIRAAVREGKPLASALEAAPLDIPALAVGIVRSGEGGGGLAPAVRRAADVMESAAATRSAIRSALVYPAILAASGGASIALLVGIVLPRFAEMLVDLGQEIPPTTSLVLSAASGIRAGAIPGVLVFAALLALWRTWTATPAGRLRWHEILLGVPLLGSVRRASAGARSAASLAALLESGAPLPAALRHAARAAGDEALAARLDNVRKAIGRGTRLSAALEDSAALSPTAVRLVRAGEETGRLSAMFAHIARLERDLAERLVRGAVKLLEPGLILLFGGVVAFVAAALLQAVYGVRPG